MKKGCHMIHYVGSFNYFELQNGPLPEILKMPLLGHC